MEEMEILTSREIRVALLRMVSAGVPKKDIAKRAQVHENSIRNITNAHVSRVNQRSRMRLTPIIREWQTQQQLSQAS